MVTSPFRLEKELCNLKHILLDNSYLPFYGSDKCPVYLKLPWIKKNGQPNVEQIVSDWATKLCVAFSTRGVFPSFEKDKVHLFF